MTAIMGLTQNANPNQAVRVALAGAPNAGKSTLFNRLTGGNQKIGNYPGVTVEKKSGEFLTPGGRSIELVDLPGTYSLDAQSEDERVAVQTIFQDRDQPPALVVVVLDAANLERSLGLVLDFKKTGCEIIVALNMMDLATRRGLKLDMRAFEKRLGAKIVPTISVQRDGAERLLESIDAILGKNKGKETDSASASSDAGTEKASAVDGIPQLDYSPAALRARSVEIDSILAEVVKEQTQADRVTSTLDRALLHPVLGLPILFGILFLVFQAVFAWAAVPMDMIEGGLTKFGARVGELLPAGLLHDLIVDGIIAGVGSVLVFLPQIVILFFFILLLEASGYMARASFLLNRAMAAVGLQGQAAVPLLSSFACAIPGLMATRTIKSPRERLITMMIAPLMTCSARLPVYTLLVGAFIPATLVWGVFTLQGIVMFALFLTAIISAMIVALVLKRYAVKGPRAPFIMDLPTYKLPRFRYVVMNLILRAKAFLRRAGTMILAISIVLWFLSTFPRPPENAELPAIQYSYAGIAGHAIEPLVRPIGFDWRISAGLVPGFAAREVMVGALGTVFAVEDAEESGMSSLQEKIAQVWGLPTGLALLAWYIFSPQCLATFAVLRRESNSRKWTAVTFCYMLALAWIAAFIVFNITKLLT
jgi:ferrous iron transport protein B